MNIAFERADLSAGLQDTTTIDRLCQKESRIKRMVRYIFGFDRLRCEWFPKRILRKIFHCREPRDVEIGRVFVQCMNDLECTPVSFGSAEQKINYQAWNTTAEKLAKYFESSGSSRIHQLGVRIEAKRLGMLYRLEEVNGGSDKTEEKGNGFYQEIQSLAKKWKKNQPNLDELCLTDADKTKLEEVCRYDQFAALLNKEKFLREEFFKWIIRDHNDVATFVEFSGLIDRMGSILTKRFEGLSKVEKISHEKILTLPFASQRFSVLDPKLEVTLENDYELTVDKAIRTIQNKNNEEGSVNFYPARGCGFTHWNINSITNSYDKINTSRKGWYKKIPAFQEYTEQEFKCKFHHLANIDAGTWFSLLRSARTRATMDVDGTHGWFAFAYPDKKRKVYVVIDIGKFPEIYPSDNLVVKWTFFKFIEKWAFVKLMYGLWNYTKFMLNTTKGVLAMPDDNTTYKQRQATHLATKLTDKGKKICLEKLKKKIDKANKGTLTFQVGGKGCSRFAESLYNKTQKESEVAETKVFQCRIAKFRPDNWLLGKMRKVVAMSPLCLQKFAFRAVMLPFGPWRRYEQGEAKNDEKSFWEMQPWKDGIMSHPARLHQQQIKQMQKYAKGKITWKQADLLNHWSEDDVKNGQFRGFLQKAYNEAKR